MRLKSQSALRAIVSNSILTCFLLLASSAHATTIAFEDFQSGSNGWLDRDSGTPTANAQVVTTAEPILVLSATSLPTPLLLDPHWLSSAVKQQHVLPTIALMVTG